MTILGYIEVRKQNLKLLKHKCNVIDKTRIFASVLFSYVPKKFPHRERILNKITEGITVIFQDNRYRITTLDGLYIINLNHENNIAHWFVLNSDSNFVDVGANIGRYCIDISKRLYGLIYAFEPCKKTFKCLSHNIFLNNAFNVIPYNIGLSDMNQEEILNITNYSGRNSITLKGDIARKKEIITVARFDDIAKRYGITNIGLIKIDTEGHELHVLNGMIETLIKYKPRLIIEVIKENENDVFSFLHKIGYTVKEHIDNDILAIHEVIT